MMIEHLVQGRHDETTGAGEDLVSAPDHVIRRANHGIHLKKKLVRLFTIRTDHSL